MQKLKVIEEEDGKVRFELDRGRTLLVVVLGSDYNGVQVFASEIEPNRPISYADAISWMLENLDQRNALVIPKVEGDNNEIEVYEFYQ